MTEERPSHSSADVPELLRQRLESATGLLPVAPPPAQLLRRLGTRRRRRRRIAQSLVAVATTAGATAAIVTLAGTNPRPSGTAPTVTPSSRQPELTVPWIGRVYKAPSKTPSVRPDPSLAPAPNECLPSALQVTGAFESPAPLYPVGTVQARVEAKNVSSEPCELSGEVFTRVESSAGQILVKDEFSLDIGYGPEPALLPGAVATTTVHWISWCGQPVSDWKLLVSLGRLIDHTYVAVSLPSPPPLPGCRHHQSGIGGGFWRVLNSFGQPEKAPVAVLQAKIEPDPIYSRAGGVFDFSVLVSNPSRGPVTLPLHPCPYYATGMSFPRHNGSESLVGNVYYLNCKAMPRSLAPAQSVRLLMRVHVPASDEMFGPNRPGVYGFDWNVSDWGLVSQHVRLILR